MYQLLKVFGDVMQRVRAEYVDPVDDKDMVENAINGMLTGLDPHSSYMNAKAFKDMQIQTKGEFGGLGIEVNEDKGIIKVVSPIDDTRPRAPGSSRATSSRRWTARPYRHVAERRGRSDARPAELQDRADHQAPERRQADRGRADPRDDPHPGGEVAHGAERHRLCPAVAVHRTG